MWIATVYVTSYLWKSADFRESLCGNLRIVCGKPVELSFGNSQNCLSGARGFMSHKNFAEHLRVDTKRHSRLWKERVEQLSDIVLTSQLNAAGDDSSEIGIAINLLRSMAV